MPTVVVPGSFDPPTRGHRALIESCLAFADRVVVVVAHNEAKRGVFTPAERVDLLRATLEGIEGVEVCVSDGLVVDVARAEGAAVIAKGIRSGADADNELAQADLNARLGGIPTVLVPTGPAWASVSSSAVREIARCGGDVSAFVSEAVARALADWRKRETRHDH